MTPERLAEIEDGCHSDLVWELVDACKELMRERDSRVEFMKPEHDEILELRAKLAEIRAVVEKGLKYDWTNAEAGLLRYHQYVERLEEVIGE